MAQRDCRVLAGLKVIASMTRARERRKGGGAARSGAEGGVTRLALAGGPVGLLLEPDASRDRLALLSTSQAAVLVAAM
eukprot:16163540-Heterocapsa_arctica.AAC.1